ncbi:MAG TPA: ATP-binding cassette domain-containing protein [Geopsychrobacteraceae bacterium]|nr:ATP-binding cassette domain-containing protein [Geopsychrobacteraceae bacterium]
MAKILEMHNVRLQRGDFSLRVKQLSLITGHLYALKGSNGAGKSTLLQLLALLQPPQCGRLVFDGQPVCFTPTTLKVLRQQITLLEQNPFLFSGSVQQNLAFGLKLRGVRGKEQQLRIEEALETTGLQGFAQRPARELSGGEARRVALARALVLQPKLLLLDEPTANLDGGQVVMLERFLVGLPQQGITVVIATHDDRQPERLGGEIITLSDGELQMAKSEGQRYYQPLCRVQG